MHSCETHQILLYANESNEQHRNPINFKSRLNCKANILKNIRMNKIWLNSHIFRLSFSFTYSWHWSNRDDDSSTSDKWYGSIRKFIESMQFSKTSYCIDHNQFANYFISFIQFATYNEIVHAIKERERIRVVYIKYSSLRNSIWILIGKMHLN